MIWLRKTFFQSILDINLRDVVLRNPSLEGISIAYTAGVFLGQFLFVDFYLLITVLLLLILLLKYPLLKIFFCGIFAYSIFSFIGISIDVPKIITDCSISICSYIDSLPIAHGDLVKALLQGDKSGLSRETISLFRNAGAAHLLALSGLHMAILYGCATVVLKPLKTKYRSIILIAFALFFCLMTGARPSIVRAFLFIVIREVSILRDDKQPLIKTLFLALLIQLIVYPTVIESVGFQLSYCAVLGIALLCPWLETHIENKSDWHYIWDPLCVSISAQLFTAPLCWYYFHSFPKYFLLTNFLAIPLTTAFMILAIVVVVLSYVGICPTFLYDQLDYLGDFIIFILKTINTF